MLIDQFSVAPNAHGENTKIKIINISDNLSKSFSILTSLFLFIIVTGNWRSWTWHLYKKAKKWILKLHEN